MASIYSSKIASDILAAIRKELESFRKYVINSIKYQEISSDQIPYGSIIGSKIAPKAVTVEKIDPDAIVPISMVIESSGGAVLKSASLDTSAMLTARVYKGTTDITLSLASERFMWERDSGNAEEDADWAEDHAGAYNVEISASEFAIRPTTYRCSVEPVDESDTAPRITGTIIMQFVQGELYSSATEPEDPPNGFIWNDTENTRILQWSDVAEDWIVLSDYPEVQKEITALRSGTIDSETYQSLLEAANDITAVAHERSLMDNLAKTLNFGPEGLAMTSLGGEYNMLLGVQSIDFRKGTVIITTFGNTSTVTSPTLQIGKTGQASRMVLGNMVMQTQANGDIVVRKR